MWEPEALHCSPKVRDMSLLRDKKENKKREREVLKGKELALYVADPGSTPSTKYGSLSTAREPNMVL